MLFQVGHHLGHYVNVVVFSLNVVVPDLGIWVGIKLSEVEKELLQFLAGDEFGESDSPIQGIHFVFNGFGLCLN